MSNECNVGVFRILDDAKQAIEALNQSGFPADQISLVTSATNHEMEVHGTIETGDDATMNALFGAGIGGVLSLIGGVSAVLVGGPIAILLAGPLLAAAPIVGAVLGGLKGWGVHHSHIPKYEALINSGKVLVITHGNPLEVARANRILAETSAETLEFYAETDADDPNIVLH
ncbi:MAG: hypothetical protein COA78_12810 [Blastopirellula sp.]|nr:MAG: hypothetical protein COA78_12810 [Blastopirellula sp.]